MNFEAWRQENIEFFSGAIAKEFSRRANDSMEEGLKMCESPIEKMLYTAMCVIFQQQEMVWGTTFCPCFPEFNSLEHLRKCESMPAHMLTDSHAICCQVPIGRYRADFAARRIVPLKRSRAIISPILIIECDGHDFHERTKDQAQRDKSRDRAMLAEGFRVIRFTGSEVFKDYWRCANEVLAMLKGMTDEMIRDEVGRDMTDEQAE